LKFKGQQLNKINLKQNSIFRITESRPALVSSKKRIAQTTKASETTLLSALGTGRLDECGRV
jgi:hypothetical protein